jgi:diguanylate cyclase (GGDEF)-like protein
MLDVDRFKLVNDVCGHEGGDRLLKEVSQVLKIYLHEGSVLARTGDDEFGILVENCPPEFGFRIAETQRRAIENLDFRWEGRHFPVSVSVGMVNVDRTAATVSQLLREVDSACFLAKEAGRNLIKVFEASDEDVRSHQGAVRAVPLIEKAIQEGRLKLFAQRIEPIFLDEGAREHYEILLRVLDEEGQPLPPAEFIEAVERFDRMRSLDRWVAEHIFAWLDRHAARIAQVGGFSMNLSGHSLGDPSMLRLIVGHLERTRYPRDRLAFEITETAMVRNMSTARSFVERIKKLGCSLYLDDFGSGMSSYAYLKEFPVDCIKIDGAFIRNISSDEKDLALVKSITEIAHFSNRKVIAEYVEDEATLVKLRELEVDFVQGYAIGRPFPLEDLLTPG